MAENVFIFEMHISRNKALNLIYVMFPSNKTNVEMEMMADVSIYQIQFLLQHIIHHVKNNSVCLVMYVRL